MEKLKCRALVTMFALVVFVFSATAQTTWAEMPAVDPNATKILKRMTDYLGNLKQFSVLTQNTVEDLLLSGHRVDVDISSEVTVSRPNMLRSDRKGDLLVNQVFFYDGKSLTLFNPTYNMYATESVPDTFEELFMYMYKSVGLAVPVSDLIYADSFPLLMQDVTMAIVIGKTAISGVTCDHLLFSRPGVDFQVWVSDGPKPLPIKYVVTETATSSNLSVSTTLSNWNVDPKLTDDQFVFTPPKGAQATTFMPF